MRRRILLVSVVLLLVGAAAVAALIVAPGRDQAPPGAAPEPSPASTGATDGAGGAGDPYFPNAGNGGYEVAGYDIDLRYEPSTDRLDGRATITANALGALRSFSLDLRLPATAVEVDGQQAMFSQDRGELRVTPAVPVTPGTPVRITVAYGGVPSQVPAEVETIAKPWTRVRDGAVGVGEPEGAAWWFPANDHPSDKATVAVSASVPAGVEVISNGALLGGPEPQPDGRDVWRWRADQPMAPYLAFVAIGQYDLVRRDTTRGPFVAAYQAGTSASARAAVERTPEVVAELEKAFGPYPFAELGGVIAPVTGFALENQTRPVYDAGFFAGDDGLAVVVHENAHQWFGDVVSVARWRDIWLNEGFATYAEWLFDERTGRRTAAETARLYYSAFPAEAEIWKVAPADPGAQDLFDISVYVRGAMAVQALRDAIGDERFFAVLRAWLTERGGGNGTVEDFLALAERVSGQELDGVAKEWLYDRDRPPAAP